MKSYTDLDQSRKLAEFLPIKSADMGWNAFVDNTTRILPIDDWDLSKNSGGNLKFYPAWSLAALLSVLSYPHLEQYYEDKWYCKAEYAGTAYIYEENNPVDTCYEMILKLHELNLL